MDWIDLAQDREKYLTVGNLVVKTHALLLYFCVFTIQCCELVRHFSIPCCDLHQGLF